VETRLGQLGLADLLRHHLRRRHGLAPNPTLHRTARRARRSAPGGPQHRVRGLDHRHHVRRLCRLFTIVCPGPLTVGHDLGLAHLRVHSHEELSLASICTEFEEWLTHT
jgi:hypothetical protein